MKILKIEAQYSFNSDKINLILFQNSVFVVKVTVEIDIYLQKCLGWVVTVEDMRGDPTVMNNFWNKIRNIEEKNIEKIKFFDF